MPPPSSHARPTVLAVWLIIAGVIGWAAAFELTLERLRLLADPAAVASCDVSVLVQCTKNLESAQGSVFGFPNPLLGLAGWIAPIVVGAAILGGARFANWFWALLWVGLAFAFGFSLWLIGQSIFVLGTLCIWCMVTWAMAIPTFYAVTLHLLRIGVVPVSAGARSGADRLMVWVPLMAFVSCVVIAVIAQVRLDAISNIVNTVIG